MRASTWGVRRVAAHVVRRTRTTHAVFSAHALPKMVCYDYKREKNRASGARYGPPLRETMINNIDNNVGRRSTALISAADDVGYPTSAPRLGAALRRTTNKPTAT